MLNSSDLSSLVGGLRRNGLLRYSHMLTGMCVTESSCDIVVLHVFPGYVGTQSFLEHVSDVVVELKERNKAFVYGKPVGC